MSVPVLSVVPADTSYIKYGHVSLQNRALNARKKNAFTPHDSPSLQTCGQLEWIENLLGGSNR